MKYSIEDYKAKAREAVSEGIVLLENKSNTLPLKSGTRVAVFGRSQLNYYKSGTGSGGLVNTSYVISILDALMNEEKILLDENLRKKYENWVVENPFDTGVGWAAEPWFQKEMHLTEDYINQTSEINDVAIVIIGRSAGEDKDNKLEKGSYLLTDEEEYLLKNVCKSFEKVVVLLNTGNIIDMNWVESYKPSAVAYVWQGGQEGGNGIVDVLLGRVNPSGKLPDTIVRNVNDIPFISEFGDKEKAVYKEDIYVGYRYFETFAPEKVMYPFGYGLTYSDFQLETLGLRVDDGLIKNDQATNFFNAGFELEVQVKNIGNTVGKEVAQVYIEAPQGLLGKPLKSLVGFSKTNYINPNEVYTLNIKVPAYYFASYDDSGITGNKSCYVIEQGTYKVYVGTDVRNSKCIASFDVPELIVVDKLSEAMAPAEEFNVLKPVINDNNDLIESYIPVANRTISYDDRIKENSPKNYEIIGDKGYKLADVANGKVDMETFISQLSKEDLVTIVRGEGMCSPKATPGIAGAFGGVTESLKKFGIPIAGCADGPSGIRMDCGTLAFSMPNGTLLASTFNTELCEELYEWEGLELRRNKIDTLLGPGMNIHRNPLNGRNFEYFSEDPILTGKMACAQLRGMHKYGVTGTIKHFACNNQETNRHGVNAIVSERAIREIYLKGFELAVREENAYTIMSSYNPINGYWAASNYELLTTILRDEWGYEGIVMTDWWAKGNFTGENGLLSNVGAKIQAQNDLIMVNADASDMNCDNSMEVLENGRVSIGDYQKAAANICKCILRLPIFDRTINGEDEIDERLSDFVFVGGQVITNTIEWNVDKEGTLNGNELLTGKGDLNLITLSVKNRGIYSASVTYRASEQEKELAQIPLTILVDKEIIGSITAIGSEKEWKTYTIESLPPLYMNNCYVKLLFGQGGMEIKDVKLTLVTDLEEKIKEYWESNK